jgi:hypothetical protein
MSELLVDVRGHVWWLLKPVVEVDGDSDGCLAKKTVGFSVRQWCSTSTQAKLL